MEEILRMARELGEAIAKHPHYLALRRAEEAAGADQEAKTLVEQFNNQQERIVRLTQEKKPIEAEDKRAFADLQQKVMSNDLLKRLQAAQVDFRYLMDTINRAIREAIEPPGEQEAKQASE